LKAVALLIAAMVVALLIARILRKAPAETFIGLRNMFLQSSREKLGLPAVSVPTEPWGVMMDMSVAKGTATASVTSLSDGNASIYLSTGGGYIGGVGKLPIHNAAQKFVRAAAEFQPMMKTTTEFPLPEPSQVNFYVLTDSGVFTARVPEQELNQRRHPFTKLFAAGQEVITQYRLDQGAAGK
jgi:hypothetical protein